MSEAKVAAIAKSAINNLAQPLENALHDCFQGLGVTNEEKTTNESSTSFGR